MVQVYSEPLCRRHYASLFGDAVLFRVLLFLGSVVASLVIAFATGGFWPKVKPTLDQPTVRYTHDALLLLEGAQAGQERIWSSSSAINSQFEDYFVAASVQAGEEDYNFDGKADAIIFRAQVHGNVPVHGVKALLQFSYNFDSNVRLKMHSLAYIAHTSPAPGGKLSIDGELVLQQRRPITDRKYNGIYDYPILNSSSPGIITAVQGTTTLDFQNIIKLYLDRNYTTVYANQFPVWKAGAGNSFTLEARIRIPPHQVVWYRPQIIEMLKFGWIQFLATYVVIWWLFWWFQYFAFSNGVLTTRVVSDVQPKAQRF